MIVFMKVRCVALAFVSSVLFAALVANPGAAGASENSANQMAQLGYAALNGGDAPKALPLFTQAIESRELAPEALATTLLNRALAYQRLGQDNYAVDDYTAALNVDALGSDLRARVLYNRGLAQNKRGQATLAIEDFTSALLVNPSFAHAYLGRADALRENGQYLFAISDYERAAKFHHPQAAAVYYGEALTYESLRRPADAKRFLQAAVAADATFKAAADRLKAMGDVAENEDTAVDPILVSSTQLSPTDNTTVVGRQTPKAIEPPAALLAQDISADAGADITLADDKYVADPTSSPLPQAAMASGETLNKKATLKNVPNVPGAEDAVTTASTTPAAKITANTSPPDLMTGWVVQISSATTEDGARGSWKKLRASHNALAGLDATVVKAETATKGTVYRVRLGGYASQAVAQQSCGKLKLAGISCFVAKAEG